MLLNRETLKVTSFCSFDFQKFPFDSHKCDLILGSQLMAVWRIKLAKPHIMFRIVKSGKYKAEIETNSKQVPFDMMAVSMDPFKVLSDGVNYSYTGITIHFERNDIGKEICIC